MRIASDGNVGIGTTNPTANLEINTGSTSSVNITSQLNGSIAFGNVSGSSQAPVIVGKSSSNNSPLTFIGAATNANTNGDVVFNARENNNSPFATLTNPAFKFQHYTTDLVTILRSGNVGIGTTSPSYPFHVYNETVDTVARFESGDTSAAISLKASDNTALFTTSGTDFLVKNDGSGNLRFFNNGSERLRIDSSGNVGIGTTSPGAKLDVNGSIKAAGNAKLSSTAPALKFEETDRTDENWAFIASGGKLSIRTANDNFSSYDVKMLINQSGNVGIGTTSPAVSLDISATDAVQMPVGITNDRPLTGVSNGMLRYNSTNNEFEGYINGNWGSIGGGASGGLIFRGTFDASTGAIASGGSLYTCPAGGSGGTVDTAIGDLYIVTTAGSFFCSGTSLNVGDEVICITAATATNDNVNNWNAIASGAGGAVTGSGTTNYVPKFTGATVVGNSSIFNDASGNVGIGTTSPS